MKAYSDFSSGKELIEYLENKVKDIQPLDECRLYREEQYNISENVLIYRNCVEWLIRINKIIDNLNYAISKSLSYCKLLNSPLEDNENKRFYSYYLEDAVYRDLVLWDMYRQLMNEFFKCGVDKMESISIFKFIKDYKAKIGITRFHSLDSYLKSAEHKKVREKLRNSFTHSVDATSSYLFHNTDNGQIEPQLDYVFPSYPLENIYDVIRDIFVLLTYFDELIKEINHYRSEYLSLYNVEFIMLCGKRILYPTPLFFHDIIDNKDDFINKCEDDCEHSFNYDLKKVCIPNRIGFYRIHEKDSSYKEIICSDLGKEITND